MPRLPPTATAPPTIPRLTPRCGSLRRWRARGQVSDADFAAVKDAGYTDAQVIEIVQHVALNTFTNLFNEVFQTDIDFPVVQAVRHAD